MLRRVRGLTLIELLLVLAVAGILAMVALPALQDFIARNARTVAVNRFVLAIQYARSESVKRVAQVSVCKSRDGRQCGGSETSWAEGWLVFVNRDRDWPPRRDPGEPVLRVFGPLPAGLSATANRPAFTLRPLGRYSTNGTLTVCAAGGTAPRAVIVSVTGRPRTSSQRPDGSALSCVE